MSGQVRLVARRVAVAAVAVTLAFEARGWAHRCARGWIAPGLVNVRSPLAARVLGAGSPIVLVHGLGASNCYWGGAYDRLADRHLLIVPDMLGFGESPRPPHGYGPGDHAAALAQSIESTGAQGRALVAAHSVGCLIALRLAATRPELVAGIVAFGPPIYPDRASARRHIDALGPMARLFANDTPSARVVCEWVCNHRELAAWFAAALRPDLPPQIARDGVQHTWVSYSETLRRLLLAAEASAWLDEIDVPVLFVAGTGDPVCDLAWLDHLAARHPGVTVERWQGDHDLPLSYDSEVIRRIAELADVSSSAEGPRQDEPRHLSTRSRDR